MSSISKNWAELASQNERLLRAADTQLRQADDSPVTTDPARWAELASQRERLFEHSDPQYRLASSPRHHSALRLARAGRLPAAGRCG
jgi:hypothetical protein